MSKPGWARAWVLVAGLTAAGAGPASAQLGGGGWAQGLFAEKGHDFGPVPRGAVVRHHFALTNRTNEPITILDVRASCGCTTGRALTPVIGPGQTGYVEAQMDTRNFVGVKATTLTVAVVTGSGRQGEARLGVQSNILSDIVLNPGTVELGVVARGQPAGRVLTIDRHGAPNWRVVQMMASRGLSAAIDAQVEEVGRTAQGVSYRLTVSLRPDAPAGSFREEIRIVTNDPESPVVPVLVTGEVRGGLAASPALLAMGRVQSAAPVQGRFLVRGLQPFAIARIEGAGDGFEVEAAEPDARKAMHVVTVTYRPEAGAARGDLQRVFRVHTDLAGEPPLDLNVSLHVDP